MKRFALNRYLPPWVLKLTGLPILGVALTSTTLAQGVVTPPVFDIFTALDWACTGKHSQTIENAVLQACGVIKGGKTACDVIDGTPFACYNYEIKDQESKRCFKSLTTGTITGDAGGLGWKVVGTVTYSSWILFEMKDRKKCRTDPIIPPPDGDGGTFASRSGTVWGGVVFHASGTGSVTFLGGEIFSKSVNEKCERFVEPIKVQTKSTVNGCKAPKCDAGADVIDPSSTDSTSASECSEEIAETEVVD